MKCCNPTWLVRVAFCCCYGTSAPCDHKTLYSLFSTLHQPPGRVCVQYTERHRRARRHPQRDLLGAAARGSPREVLPLRGAAGADLPEPHPAPANIITTGYLNESQIDPYLPHRHSCRTGSCTVVTKLKEIIRNWKVLSELVE